MKVRASVKKLCRNCKIIRREGVVRVICSADPGDNQRHGCVRITRLTRQLVCCRVDHLFLQR